MNDTPQLLALMQKTRDMRAYDCVKEFESLARKLEKENIALRNLLLRIRTERDLLKTRPGGQDQYAGMPPVYRLIDAALARKEAQP